MISYGVVYLIRNLENGKVYVGQTTQALAARWKQHCFDSIVRRGFPLHLAIRKYGRDLFEIVVLAECSDQDELNLRESELIAEYRACERGVGYNVRGGGDGGGPHSAETRSRLSARLKGRIANNKGKKMPESQHIAMLKLMRENNPNIGKICSAETRAKIGAANAIRGLGRVQSEATRQKHTESNLRRFASPEARRKHSESMTGHPCSPETREKIRAKMLGRTVLPEWREKIRQFNLGRKQSPEHIANRMLGMKLARERKAGIVE